MAEGPWVLGGGDDAAASCRTTGDRGDTECKVIADGDESDAPDCGTECDATADGDESDAPACDTDGEATADGDESDAPACGTNHYQKNCSSFMVTFLKKKHGYI